MMREASAALKPTGRTAPARSALTEDVPRLTLPDHALDPVDELHRLDPTLQQAEQRTVVALVCRVLARRQADISRHAGEALVCGRIEVGKDPDPTYLLGRDHALTLSAWPVDFQPR